MILKMCLRLFPWVNRGVRMGFVRLVSAGGARGLE